MSWVVKHGGDYLVYGPKNNRGGITLSWSPNLQNAKRFRRLSNALAEANRPGLAGLMAASVRPSGVQFYVARLNPPDAHRWPLGSTPDDAEVRLPDGFAQTYDHNNHDSPLRPCPDCADTEAEREMSILFEKALVRIAALEERSGLEDPVGDFYRALDRLGGPT